MQVVDIDRSTLKARLEAGTITLIDVREPDEFAAGHIPGAISMPLSRFYPEDLAAFPADEIVFYCRSGQRSRTALGLAQHAGVDVGTHYPGSMLDWVAAGEPVALGDGEPPEQR